MSIPVSSGIIKLTEYQVESWVLKGFSQGLPWAREKGDVMFVFEHQPQSFANAWVIVYYQDFLVDFPPAVGGRVESVVQPKDGGGSVEIPQGLLQGRVTVNESPVFGVDSAPIRPPNCSTMLLQTLSPLKTRSSCFVTRCERLEQTVDLDCQMGPFADYLDHCKLAVIGVQGKPNYVGLGGILGTFEPQIGPSPGTLVRCGTRLQSRAATEANRVLSRPRWCISVASHSTTDSSTEPRLTARISLSSVRAKFRIRLTMLAMRSAPSRASVNRARESEI